MEELEYVRETPLVAVALGMEQPLSSLQCLRNLRRRLPEVRFRCFAQTQTGRTRAVLQSEARGGSGGERPGGVHGGQWCAGSDLLFVPDPEPLLLPAALHAWQEGIPVVSWATPTARQLLGLGSLWVERCLGWEGVAEIVQRVLTDPTEREAAARHGRKQARRALRRLCEKEGLSMNRSGSALGATVASSLSALSPSQALVSAPPVSETWVAGRECPLCGEPGVAFGCKAGYPLRECRCEGPVLLSWPWGSVAEYQRWYQEDNAPYHGAHQATQGLAPMWQRDGEYLQAASVRYRVLSGLFPWVRRVLDIGAGTGAWVAELQAHGVAAVGYEPSPEMARQAQARGRNVCVGGWEDIPAPDLRPDLVTMHDVFEHLPDPHGCVRRLQALVGPAGLLCIEMPEWDCPQARAEGAAFRHVRPLEHVALYGERAATELFRRAGLEVVALVRPLEGRLGKVAYYLRSGSSG